MRRRRRYQRFSEAEQDEVWRLVASGERYVDVAAALGGTRQGVRGLLGRTGGLRPRPRHRSPRHLSALEREEISRALLNGSSLRGIAARLARAPSSIAREVRRNGGRAAYRAVHADRRASDRGRRPKVAKLVRQPLLRSAVEGRLARRWSPQQIAVSLRRDYPDDPAMHVSHETIYQSLFVQSRGALRRELTRYLRRPRLQRRTPQRVDDRGRLPGMLNIRERPAEVADRAVPGHWEGDLLAGAGNRSAVATLVERQTRYVLLARLGTDRTTEHVIAALKAQIQTLPAQLARSLTWDQGKELAAHKAFTVQTGVAVYFCDPHSPWQRGSNENTNGLLRQYLPKRSDLAACSQVALDAIAAELNDRPRKTLAWSTPAEKMTELLR